MKNLLICLICLITLSIAACAPQAPVVVPTVVELPTQTPIPPTVAPTTGVPGQPTALLPTVSDATATPSQELTPTEDQTLAAMIVELTVESAELETAAANASSVAVAAVNTATLDPSQTATVTETLAPGLGTYITFTPSDTLDVTYTPGPSRTPTNTRTPEPAGLELLAMLAAGFTVLPPEVRYNPATQTGLALAVTAAVQTGTPPAGGTATATLAGGAIPTATRPPVVCAVPAPSSITTALSGEPALANQLGCSIGGSIQISAATQLFERGSMIYMTGTPGDIYVLTSDGRYRRYPDTWVQGIDPDSAGMTPPPGLLEPIRGFGKAWRTNPGVQSGLGWATGGESGATATLLLFERGRVMYLPPRNETIILIPDAGSTDAGVWRSFIGSF